MNRCLVGVLLTVLSLAGPARAQDVASGPDKGAPVPALKVYDATGAYKDKEVDYAADRKGRLTVYVLLQADKFDRPMNRFLKGVDGAVTKDFPAAHVVAVWLTGDADRTKALLPRVQESVRYESMALTCLGGTEGPTGWNVNGDAHLTVVVANKGKVAATFGYRSVNETDVPAVRAALNRAGGRCPPPRARGGGPSGRNSRCGPPSAPRTWAGCRHTLRALQAPDDQLQELPGPPGQR